MSDVARLRNDIETIVSILAPDTDFIKLKIRLEEITEKYNVTLKTSVELTNDLSDNIELYISARRIEGLSEKTLEGYQSDLKAFDKFVQKPTAYITTHDIRKYLSSLNVMASSAGKILSILKTFFGWLVDEEIILRNPANRINNIKQPQRLPKALSVMELEQVRVACKTSRDRALIELLYSTGCRLSEVSAIKRKDVDWDSGTVKVIGKGNKERIVYFNARAIYYIKAYLDECIENENDCEYLLSTELRPYRKMSPRTIQDAVNHIEQRADISKKITPHVFRHTMATLAMDNGIELGDLQQLLGHSSSNTTLRYARVSEERKRSAHKRYVQ